MERQSYDRFYAAQVEMLMLFVYQIIVSKKYKNIILTIRKRQTT